MCDWTVFITLNLKSSLAENQNQVCCQGVSPGDGAGGAQQNKHTKLKYYVQLPLVKNVQKMC